MSGKSSELPPFLSLYEIEDKDQILSKYSLMVLYDIENETGEFAIEVDGKDYSVLLDNFDGFRSADGQRGSFHILFFSNTLLKKKVFIHYGEYRVKEWELNANRICSLRGKKPSYDVDPGTPMRLYDLLGRFNAAPQDSDSSEDSSYSESSSQYSDFEDIVDFYSFLKGIGMVATPHGHSLSGIAPDSQEICDRLLEYKHITRFFDDRLSRMFVRLCIESATPAHFILRDMGTSQATQITKALPYPFSVAMYITSPNVIGYGENDEMSSAMIQQACEYIREHCVSQDGAPDLFIEGTRRFLYKHWTSTVSGLCSFLEKEGKKKAKPVFEDFLSERGSDIDIEDVFRLAKAVMRTMHKKDPQKLHSWGFSERQIKDFQTYSDFVNGEYTISNCLKFADRAALPLPRTIVSHYRLCKRLGFSDLNKHVSIDNEKGILSDTSLKTLVGSSAVRFRDLGRDEIEPTFLVRLFFFDGKQAETFSEINEKVAAGHRLLEEYETGRERPTMPNFIKIEVERPSIKELDNFILDWGKVYPRYSLFLVLTAHARLEQINESLTAYILGGDIGEILRAKDGMLLTNLAEYLDAQERNFEFITDPTHNKEIQDFVKNVYPRARVMANLLYKERLVDAVGLYNLDPRNFRDPSAVFQRILDRQYYTGDYRSVDLDMLSAEVQKMEKDTFDLTKENVDKVIDSIQAVGTCELVVDYPSKRLYLVVGDERIDYQTLRIYYLRLVSEEDRYKRFNRFVSGLAVIQDLFIDSYSPLERYELVFQTDVFKVRAVRSAQEEFDFKEFLRYLRNKSKDEMKIAKMSIETDRYFYFTYRSLVEKNETLLKLCNVFPDRDFKEKHRPFRGEKSISYEVHGTLSACLERVIDIHKLMGNTSPLHGKTLVLHESTSNKEVLFFVDKFINTENVLYLVLPPVSKRESVLERFIRAAHGEDPLGFLVVLYVGPDPSPKLRDVARLNVDEEIFVRPGNFEPERCYYSPRHDRYKIFVSEKAGDGKTRASMVAASNLSEDTLFAKVPIHNLSDPDHRRSAIERMKKILRTAGDLSDALVIHMDMGYSLSDDEINEFLFYLYTEDSIDDGDGTKYYPFEGLSDKPKLYIHLELQNQPNAQRDSIILFGTTKVGSFSSNFSMETVSLDMESRYTSEGTTLRRVVKDPVDPRKAYLARWYERYLYLKDDVEPPMNEEKGSEYFFETLCGLFGIEKDSASGWIFHIYTTAFSTKLLQLSENFAKFLNVVSAAVRKLREIRGNLYEKGPVKDVFDSEEFGDLGENASGDYFEYTTFASVYLDTLRLIFRRSIDWVGENMNESDLYVKGMVEPWEKRKTSIIGVSRYRTRDSDRKRRARRKAEGGGGSEGAADNAGGDEDAVPGGGGAAAEVGGDDAIDGDAAEVSEAAGVGGDDAIDGDDAGVAGVAGDGGDAAEVDGDADDGDDAEVAGVAEDEVDVVPATVADDSGDEEVSVEDAGKDTGKEEIAEEVAAADSAKNESIGEEKNKRRHRQSGGIRREFVGLQLLPSTREDAKEYLENILLDDALTDAFMRFYKVEEIPQDKWVSTIKRAFPYRRLKKMSAAVDDKYVLVKDNFYKMLLVLFRLFDGESLVLIGETGVGKTSLLMKLLNDYLHMPVVFLSVNSSTDHREIEGCVSRAERIVGSSEKRVVVFFDEFNTARMSEISLIKEIVVDKTVNGRFISPNVLFVGSINPYIKRDDSGFTLGGYSTAFFNPDNARSLVYNVNPIPPSLYDFPYDFGSLDEESEIQYIESISKRYGTNSDKLRGAIIDVHRLIRKKMASGTKNSEISIRDIVRCNKIYGLLSKAPGGDSSKGLRLQGVFLAEGTSEEELMSIAIYVTYLARLPDKKRKEYEEELGATSGVFRREHIDKALEVLKRRIKANIPEHLEVNRISLTHYLLENILVIILSTLGRIPLFIVGKPGTGKTLSFTIFKKILEAYGDMERHITYFQCSKHTTDDELEKLFEKVEAKDDASTNILILDEIGLVPSAKSLHQKLEEIDKGKAKISIVGISNYMLDPAQVGRGLLLFKDTIPESDSVAIAKEILGADYDRYSKVAQEIFDYIVSAGDKKDDVYSLRDYYSILKAIKHSIGLGKEPDMPKLYARHFGRGSLHHEGQTKAVPLRELIADNLMSTEYFTRNVMIVSDDLFILGRAFDFVREIASKRNQKVHTIYGRVLEQDSSGVVLIENITTVMRAMNDGDIVCSFVSERLYSPLYDVLNKAYTDKEKVQINLEGLGEENSVRCDKRFKMVFFVDDAEYRNLDRAVRSRFERYFAPGMHSLDPEYQKTSHHSSGKSLLSKDDMLKIRFVTTEPSHMVKEMISSFEYPTEENVIDRKEITLDSINRQLTSGGACSILTFRVPYNLSQHTQGYVVRSSDILKRTDLIAHLRKMRKNKLIYVILEYDEVRKNNYLVTKILAEIGDAESDRKVFFIFSLRSPGEFQGSHFVFGSDKFFMVETLDPHQITTTSFLRYKNSKDAFQIHLVSTLELSSPAGILRAMRGAKSLRYPPLVYIGNNKRIGFKLWVAKELSDLFSALENKTTLNIAEFLVLPVFRKLFNGRISSLVGEISRSINPSEEFTCLRSINRVAMYHVRNELDKVLNVLVLLGDIDAIFSRDLLRVYRNSNKNKDLEKFLYHYGKFVAELASGKDSEFGYDPRFSKVHKTRFLFQIFIEKVKEVRKYTPIELFGADTDTARFVARMYLATSFHKLHPDFAVPWDFFEDVTGRTFDEIDALVDEYAPLIILSRRIREYTKDSTPLLDRKSQSGSAWGKKLKSAIRNLAEKDEEFRKLCISTLFEESTVKKMPSIIKLSTPVIRGHKFLFSHGFLREVPLLEKLAYIRQISEIWKRAASKNWKDDEIFKDIKCRKMKKMCPQKVVAITFLTYFHSTRPYLKYLSIEVPSDIQREILKVLHKSYYTAKQRDVLNGLFSVRGFAGVENSLINRSFPSSIELWRTKKGVSGGSLDRVIKMKKVQIGRRGGSTPKHWEDGYYGVTLARGFLAFYNTICQKARESDFESVAKWKVEKILDFGNSDNLFQFYKFMEIFGGKSLGMGMSMRDLFPMIESRFFGFSEREKEGLLQEAIKKYNEYLKNKHFHRHKNPALSEMPINLELAVALSALLGKKQFSDVLRVMYKKSGVAFPKISKDILHLYTKEFEVPLNLRNYRERFPYKNNISKRRQQIHKILKVKNSELTAYEEYVDQIGSLKADSINLFGIKKDKIDAIVVPYVYKIIAKSQYKIKEKKPKKLNTKMEVLLEVEDLIVLSNDLRMMGKLSNIPKDFNFFISKETRKFLKNNKAKNLEGIYSLWIRFWGVELK